MDICTIIAKNYAAQARVLARSFAEHHPDGRCFALVIDDFEGYMDPDEEPFEVLTPAGIGCEDFDEMAYRYTVIELSTAVKPWLLRHLLGRRPAITYLDPDIRIYDSLQSLEDLALEHGLALTPHNTVPIPPDGERPTQIDIMIAGVYNLGYVSMAAGAQTDMLLDWWAERLLRDCRFDPVYGYFVDQRWFDLVPGLATDFAVVRDPQFNIAYWNAHGRHLDHDGERYTVDGQPLAFFHFSGFDPEEPHVLSRHQTRVRASANPALKRIMREYAAEVLAAGYAEVRHWPYTWDQLPVGVQFDRRLRALYDTARDQGAVSESPFSAEGCQQLIEWLDEPAPGAPAGVNRLLADLYGHRDDLREIFPEVARGDAERFLTWFAAEGRRDVPLAAHLPNSKSGAARDRALIAAPPPPPPPMPQPPPTPWGVNVVGYFRSEMGTGEAARQVVSALDAAGVPLLPLHGRKIPPNRQGHAFQHLDYDDARFLVNLLCMNADVLGEFVGEAGRPFFRDHYSIGLWFWEVERFPTQWVGPAQLLDEVWAPTAHVAQAVAPVLPCPVHQVRLPVEMAPLQPRSRAALGLPDGFVFLYSFDYHSVFERKNPIAAIEAFTRAFAAGEGPHLVIKSINAESDIANHERLLLAAGERPDVHVLDRYVSAADKDAMTASADCYVSLHRSEGFGLTMAEAMYVGRPVIATAYSGNLDFMTSENSYLVDYRLTPVGPHNPPYPAEARWADPDIDDAAGQMRAVYDDPDRAAEVAARGAADLRRTHSAAAAGEIMARRLEQIRQSRTWQPESALDFTAPLHSRVSAAAMRDGPLARRLLARGLMRLLGTPLGAQQRVDAEIARCLRRLEWRQEAQENEMAERHAMLLAELRRQSRGGSTAGTVEEPAGEDAPAYGGEADLIVDESAAAGLDEADLSVGQPS